MVNASAHLVSLSTVPKAASASPAKEVTPAAASASGEPVSSFSRALSMTSEAAAAQVKVEADQVEAETGPAVPPGSEAEPAQSADRAAAGGESPPPSGNILPLNLMLPPSAVSPPEMLSEGGVTSLVSPNVSQTAALQTSPPPAATVLPATSESESDTDAMLLPATAANANKPAESTVFPSIVAPASSDEGVDKAVAAAVNKAMADAANRQQGGGEDSATKKTPLPATTHALPAAAEPASAAAAAIANRLIRNDDGTDGAVLRRLLSSMNAQSADDSVPAGVVPGAANGLSSAAHAVDRSGSVNALAAQLAAASNANAAATSARAQADSQIAQLAGDISFEPTAGTPLIQPTPTAALHGLAGAQTAATTAAADVPVLQLQTPVHRPEWADGLGDRIIWLTDQNLSNAQIKLNPAHLGPIDVRISVTDDQTNVWVTAQHGTTREALEAAAPRLRELLSSQGLGNVNVNINQHSSSQHSANSNRPEPWQTYEHSAVPETSSSPVSAPHSSPRALLDAYA